ncbi:beta strand repeat-containing protein [Ralstonia pseudosolanacearum]|uniref:beta strand repeat-containing protein n=3 Tax=Ralstonia pseudosolanacearum TaxID=1310165 RepID=UPI0026756CF7|nr:calcium-binding protein [Ralstonia pseudosolanacearum]MDO3553814.1 calcium-binding protein [Ralstonia pseudosolanacearum]MDO3568265.1 calcium-binding protein [Ralstonia pseudosolanacearum]MDO3603142.1 calcium-binding protein [Ralstonia pseudosolanacearum]
MAEAYLQALNTIAKENKTLTGNDEVNRDINAKEVLDFHQKVFKENGLGIENWTLDSVFKIIQQTQGDDALEAYWESLRDTQGEGMMATLLNIRTMYNMHESIDSADPAISKLARNWMELVPGIYSSEQFMRSIKVLLRLPDVKSTLNAIDDLVNQLFRSVQFDSGRDPLVVDLGKGIRATGVDDSKVLFDLANTGQKEAVGWIASGGFLVNTADGPVTSGAQLFGDARALPDGSLAANGFQALAPLDSNADGHINASDTAFGKLAIWTDTNQDGIEQADEVFLLSKLGIQDIDLTSETSTFQNIGGGNVVTGKAKITWADGHQTDIVEANLVTNGFYTVFTDNVTLTPEQAALPFVRGSGQVRDTRQAAARSPDFSAMLQQYAAANTRAEQLALLPALIDAWATTSSFKSLMQRNTYANDSVNYEYAFAGVAHYQSTTLGYDALIAKSNWTAEYSKWTHLVDILEKFNGQTLFSVDSGWMWGHNRAFVSAVNTDGSTSAYNGASPQAGALLQATVLQISLSDQQMARLQQSYDALLDSVYGGLVLQTRLDKYVRILQSDHPADVLAALQAAYDRNPVNGASDAIDLLKYGRAALDKAGVSLAPTLQSMAQDLDSRGLLSTWLADNPGIHYTAPGQAAAIGKTGELNGLFILTGPTQKADPVQASAGQGSQGNVFFALHGNTTVDASKGDNQQFFGGDGPSRFVGGTGANRFQGGAGDMWMDGHLGSAGTFTGGKGNDTMIGGTGLNIFSGGGGDDAITSNADAVSLIDGGIGNDTIRVSGGGMASIDGGAGDDIIRIDPYGASQGADIMGGTGDDQISLGYYSTTLRFNRGDGHDTVSSIANAGNKTIVFGPGISAADLSATRVGNDMILNVGANGDAITITNWFLLDGSKRIDTAVFADGTRWNADNFRHLVTTVTGTAGDDTINGWQGDDVLVGGAGNDTLISNGGSDQLYGGAGNDSLRINNNATASVDGGDDNDTISADSGTTSTISAGNGDDTVQIGAWAMRTTVDAGNGNDIINIDPYGASQGADITGGTGDDQIRLGYYGATLHFNRGDGHDTVSSAANAGNKTIVFGPGISAADLSATRLGNDIVLNIGTNGDAITVTNWFQGDAYRIDHATFADGTQWDQNNFRHLLTTVTGTASDDTINGWQGDDVLVGGDGNDTLISNGGNDQLYGGAGNDSLRVNDNATASVDGGDGNDIISADSGTTSTISAGNGDDTVQISAWAMRTTIDAGNGNDIINIDSYGASQGADITGGTGDDQIRLGYYGATLHFNRGDGHDTVSSAANAGNKTVVFGPGISAADLSATRVGNDMVLSVGANGDAITVTNWFQLDGSKRIDTAVFADGTRWNADNFRRLVTTVTGAAGDDTINGWQGDDVLVGGAGNDTLISNGGNDQLYGGGGNDSLRVNDNATASVDGGDGNDIISADSGTTSTISAGNGDDTVQIGAWAMRTTVDAGNGNDIINIDSYGASQGTDITGGSGDDQIRLGYYGATLHFNRGDGHDTVSSAANAGNKTVVFGPGISAADLSATRVGDDMVLNIGTNGDAITVTNWFQLDGSKRIDTAVFADGTRWNADNFRRLVTTVTGAAGDDTINGWQGDDILIGGDGNDSLVANGGNDQLYGGAGNDSLRINDNATASVDGGDGNDIISADSGTTSTISAGNGDDTVQISAWAMRTTIDAGNGNDIINIDSYGASQGTDITGGTGDDQIRLGYYGATLHFNRGDGHDTVSSAANAGNKTIVFGPGISAADLSATRVGDDMVLSIGSNGDAITVTNWFQGDGYRIDHATFVDGTQWDQNNFRRLVTTVTGTAGDDTINGWQGDDILIGGDGNDTLISNGGSDQLYGGTGNDSLRINNNATASVDGGDGNDTISADSGTTSTISAGNGDDIVQIGAWSFRSTIDGGAGNDIIKIDTYGASQGADIAGGTGDDQISLGYYGATLHFNRGDGHDTVSSAANAGNKTIVFGPGISAADLSATRVGDDMVLNIGANGDAITITNWFQSGQYRLRNLMFADGTTIDATGLVATYNVNASSGTTKIQALTGFDDKPLADVINFKTANSRQLWFERQDDDLLVSVIGSHDVADFTDWYSMSTHQNLQLRAADGLSLTGQQVDALVQAMAQFSAPPAGQTTLTPELQDKLAPVIAANWH